MTGEAFAAADLIARAKADPRLRAFVETCVEIQCEMQYIMFGDLQLTGSFDVDDAHRQALDVVRAWKLMDVLKCLDAYKSKRLARLV